MSAVMVESCRFQFTVRADDLSLPVAVDEDDDGVERKILNRILNAGHSFQLSGYWYASRKSHVQTNPLTGAIVPHPITGKPQVIVEDHFRPGTTFQQVMDFYVFDKRLRLLFLDAIERVEVAIRVDIALIIGARDPWAHRDPNQLHGNFTKKTNPLIGRPDYEKWIERLDETFNQSKDEFAKHFKRKYAGEKPPIWIAIELWDFGTMSLFLSGMNVADRVQLAAKYGLPRHKLLTSWVRSISHVRNICAHHSRLWNRSPADQGALIKRRSEIPILGHLADDLVAQSRIYATAVQLQFLLRTINSTSTWARRLKERMDKFPTSEVSTVAQAGFPAGWEDLELWN
jgi:abortive infection bacteriophage resistance protein